MSAGEGNFFEAKPENQIYTVCLQCNTGCGIKVKLLEGMAAKIDGNPYSPWTLWPHPAYETPIKDMAKIEGGLCPKGQAGLQTAYDPYRITSVLNRKPGSKRGEGQWETISFEQAIDEVVNGGDLFGEGKVDGMKPSARWRMFPDGGSHQENLGQRERTTHDFRRNSKTTSMC